MELSGLHSVFVLGGVLGLRHALEPDHLAAVSTLTTMRGGSRNAFWVGAMWGLGHGGALLGVGSVLGVLQVALPRTLADSFELCVAAMLVVLGAQALLRAARMGKSGPLSQHAHGGLIHAHPSAHDHVHVGTLAFARRPLLVGVIHGLAGSGALTALSIANMPTVLGRVLFVAVFGCGSLLAMALLSGLAGAPLSRVAHNGSVARLLTASSGVLSFGFGVLWGSPVAERLFGA